MGNSLTQEEIDRLLNGGGTDNPSTLSSDDIDMIGEIGNISMGNSATALSQILNRKVNITTPQVVVLNSRTLPEEYALPYVSVEITYIEGLEGKNILNLKNDDVKIITDIMMGGPGEIKEGPIDEMNLSAAGELMNQMMGSSATALSEMFNMRLNISTPTVQVKDYSSEAIQDFTDSDDLVMTIFDLDVENTIKSKIMLIMGMQFAKEMVEKVKAQYFKNTPAPEPEKKQAPVEVPITPAPAPEENNKVNVQKVQFKSFGDDLPNNNVKGSRYDILMDVPLEVAIEIGRVKKPISEILKFTSGTIIELDKLVGEDVNIVINNKTIGKGEVVVIDEYYGMRISEILEDKI